MFEDASKKRKHCIGCYYYRKTSGMWICNHSLDTDVLISCNHDECEHYIKGKYVPGDYHRVQKKGLPMSETKRNIYHYHNLLAKAGALNRYRVAAGLSLRALAALTGVSITTVRRAELGKGSVKIKTAEKLCEILNCQIEDVFV